MFRGAFGKSGITGLRSKFIACFCLRRPTTLSRKETTTFLVVEKERQLIATVLITHDGRRGWINRLAVAKDFQHKGIARKLLEDAENILNQQGLGLFSCLIEADNPYSMAFFHKAGYIEHTDIVYFTKRKFPGI
ncbi:MAG: GNAT family N-acetyltransferase [bacterium]|nr:GNAT family N-acetyltransferase [bacterium]